MREEFETYMKQTFRGVYLASVDGRYVNEYHQCAWLAWQASRETLIVKLASLEWAPCVLQEAIDAVGVKSC